MSYIAPPRSDDTNYRGRQKQLWSKDRLFRILSVDGGGIRGIFPAAYLAEIENRFLNGKAITSYFDMIAGTSTGGIVALGLAHGLTAKQVLEIYTDRGETIFPSPRGLGGIVQKLRFLTKPKHDQSVLKDELLRIFGGKVLDDASTRLVIPTFEAVHGEPYIYKTPHHPDYQLDRHKTFVDAALHTTAAPAYFAAVDNNGHIMIDGGVWANNPTMIALVDVIACYDIPLENIRILSLGTGEESLNLKQSQLTGGINGWGVSIGVPPLFKMAARAQSKNAIGQAGLLVQRKNLIRIDVDERDRQIALDNVIQSKRELPKLARNSAESTGNRIEEMFLQDAADQFVACPLKSAISQRQEWIDRTS